MSGHLKPPGLALVRGDSSESIDSVSSLASSSDGSSSVHSFSHGPFNSAPPSGRGTRVRAAPAAPDPVAVPRSARSRRVSTDPSPVTAALSGIVLQPESCPDTPTTPVEVVDEAGSSPGDSGPAATLLSPPSGESRWGALRRIMRVANAVGAFRQTAPGDAPFNWVPETRELKVLEKTPETQQHIAAALQSTAFVSDSPWRWGWDTVLFVGTLYYAMVVPRAWVRVDPFADDFRFTLCMVMEWAFTVIFAVDIGINCNTAYINRQARFIEDRARIRRHYFRTWFLVDFAATLPLDLIAQLAGVEQFWKILYHLRLLKLIKLACLFGLTPRGELSSFYVLFHFRAAPALRYVSTAFIVTHWFSCIWIAMHTDAMKYTAAFYWVVQTLSTVGYGDGSPSTPPQRLYAVFLFALSVIINGWVMGTLASSSQKGNINSERREKMQTMLNVLHHFEVPVELQHEVLGFQFHLLHHNVSASYRNTVNSLPRLLRNRIGLYIRVKFVAELPILESASPQCLIALAQKMKSVVYEPEEFIVRAGEFTSDVYFLSHGYADVISPDGVHIGTIGKGSFFGEIAAIRDTRRTASIKALTYCDLFRLKRTDLVDILDRFEDVKQRVEEQVRARIDETRRKEAAAKPVAARVGNLISEKYRDLERMASEYSNEDSGGESPPARSPIHERERITARSGSLSDTSSPRPEDERLSAGESLIRRRFSKLFSPGRHSQRDREPEPVVPVLYTTTTTSSTTTVKIEGLSDINGRIQRAENALEDLRGSMVRMERLLLSKVEVIDNDLKEFEND